MYCKYMGDETETGITFLRQALAQDQMRALKDVLMFCPSLQMVKVYSLILLAFLDEMFIESTCLITWRFGGRHL